MAFPNILLAKDSILQHVDNNLTCFIAPSESSSLRSHARLSESYQVVILDKIKVNKEEMNTARIVLSNHFVLNSTGYSKKATRILETVQTPAIPSLKADLVVF